MLTIHGVPISVHTRKVILIARHKKIEHKVEPVIPFDPPENWLSISPTGLIPALTEEDGYKLADSAAIAAYLHRMQPEPSIYPGEDPRELAKALELDAYAGAALFRQVVHPLFSEKVIKPRLLGQSANAMEIARIESEAAPKVFGFLDSQVNGDFLIGDKPSIADFSMIANLLNYGYLGYAIDERRYPRLAGYRANLAGLELVQETLALERPFAEQMGLDLSQLV